jgi:hypothetical protein
MTSPPRLTAHDRAMRRDRIFARLLDGQSAAAVATEEGITPRRVRQMVREALDRWDANPAQDYADLQIARLEAALRALEQKIAEGDVSVIDKFVKVLGLMEKYHRDQLQLTEQIEDENDREAAFMDWQGRLAASRAAIAARLAAKVGKSAPAAAEERAASLTPEAAAEEPAAATAEGAAVAEQPVATQEIAAGKEISPPPVENPRPTQIPAFFVTHFSRA